MAGRGAKSTSKPTEAESKKKKSKKKDQEYWVSVFFCVIPYDSLKSYKKGKFQIGKKKFETVCYKHLGKPVQETGSYKKRKKYDLPLYVDCSDFTIDENGKIDEEDLYPHLVLTLLDFYNATSELLNKDKKLKVHFHIGCDSLCDPLRHGLRQVLTSSGSTDIPITYKRFAQFSRDYEAFMDRFKEKEWTFKVDYSACYNLFVSFCPGLETEHSPYEKKKREDAKKSKLELVPLDSEMEAERQKQAAAPAQQQPAAKSTDNTATDKDPNKKQPKLELVPLDSEMKAEQEKKEAAAAQAKAAPAASNQEEPGPIKLKQRDKDPNEPKPKIKIADEYLSDNTPTDNNDEQEVTLLGSDAEIAAEQKKRANQEKRTEADVDADIEREGKKNPKEKKVKVKDVNGVTVHYRNPYYTGPLDENDKIMLL